MAIEVTIHGVGDGTCAMTGREGKGLTVTFGDGFVVEGFLSHKAFLQVLGLKLNSPKDPSGSEPKIHRTPVPANGQA